MIAATIIFAFLSVFIDAYFLPVFMPMFLVSFYILLTIILLIYNYKNEVLLLAALNGLIASLAMGAIAFGVILFCQLLVAMFGIKLAESLRPINTLGTVIILAASVIFVYVLSLNFFVAMFGIKLAFAFSDLDFGFVFTAVIINTLIIIMLWIGLNKTSNLSNRIFLIKK